MKIKPDIVLENGSEIYFTPKGNNYFYDKFVGNDMSYYSEPNNPYSWSIDYWNDWRCICDELRIKNEWKKNAKKTKS